MQQAARTARVREQRVELHTNVPSLVVNKGGPEAPLRSMQLACPICLLSPNCPHPLLTRCSSSNPTLQPPSPAFVQPVSHSSVARPTCLLPHLLRKILLLPAYPAPPAPFPSHLPPRCVTTHLTMSRAGGFQKCAMLWKGSSYTTLALSPVAPSGSTPPTLIMPCGYACGERVVCGWTQGCG